MHPTIILALAELKRKNNKQIRWQQFFAIGVWWLWLSSGASHFYFHHTAACTGLLVSSCLHGNQWGDSPNELHKILQRHRLSKCPLMTFRSGGFRLNYYLSFWLNQNASLQLRWVVESQIIVYAKNILVNQKELNNNFFLSTAERWLR